MSGLTLWGRPSSVNVQKALWALDEYGLRYQHRIVAGKYGGTDSPEFRALSPVPRVPVLQVGEVGIWESHAILRHLARRHPDHPLSAAPDAADPWLDYGTSTFQPAFLGLFWQMVRTLPADRSEAAMAQSRKALAEALDVLGARLTAAPYLAGDAMTIADIGVGAPMYRLGDIAPELLAGRDAVNAWVGRLQTRPAWDRFIATSYEELRVT